MKQIIYNALIATFLMLMPLTNFAQAPDLGLATSFSAFTAVGAFNSLGTTSIIGDIGTNVGAFSGFPPGVVIGAIHVADAISAQAAVDVDNAYSAVAGLTCGSVIGVTLGNGQTLTPDIYCTGAASTLNGNLTLDAQGDPDALFIFQIDGAFATSTFSSVTLINGASLCNVYWQVNGEFDLGDFSVFKGTVLANGAINLLLGSSVMGRILSREGAISLFSNMITLGLPAEAAVITASGPISFCIGGSVTLSGNLDGGVWNTGETTTSITVTTSGDYFVTNTTICGSAESNHIIVTVNPLPICFIAGDLIICEGETTDLCGPPGLSYLWSNGAITECITVFTSGNYILTIIDANGCTSTCSANVIVNPLPVCSITGDLSICLGSSTELCAPLGFVSYLWNTGATTNCITVSTGGTYTLTVTDLNGCNSTCSVTVTVNLLPVCSITGDLSLCGVGETTELCAPPGYVYLWSTGEITACINVGLAGIYSVTLIDLNGCSSTCSVAVVVNLPPVCSIVGDLSICPGSSTELCGPIGFASYLWSNGATTNCITVNTPGIYMLTLVDLFGCSSTCSVEVIVNAAPVCSITGDLLLCEVGQTTDLCAPLGYVYLWSTGETTACINVGLAGIYSVTLIDLNGCSSTCTVLVVANPAPVCSITGDLLLCEGETTQLCVPPGAASYLWSNGAMTNCINVSLPGIYSVIVTQANGCTSTCSATVVVNLLPVCSIVGDLSICLGSSTELCGPIGFASYLWSNGATTNCITVNTPGIYILTIVDLFGCSSTCSVEVIVNAAPVCSITGDLLLCQVGQTTELCAPLGYVSYLWNTGAITNCITVGLPGTYTVTVIDLNGCSSTCSATVSLSPIPVCTITGDLLLCEGESTQLCVPSGASSYLWSTGATTNCITVNLPGIYSVLVVQANGCNSACEATVVVTPPPVCSITGDLSICTGQSTLLCAPPGFASYLWNTGATTNCIMASVSGVYSLTVTDLNGCTSSCSVTVNVAPPLVCSITGNLLLCTAGSTELCVLPGAASYLWSTGATTNCITVSLAGVYSVTIIDLNGCSSTCSVTVVADTTPPVITCPAGLSIECDDLSLPPNTGTATATDNCTLAPAITFSDLITAGTCPQAYTITRIWTATDANGNSSTCVQTITINDNTPPTLICPDNVTVQCAIQIPAINTGFVVASDNCGGLVTVIHVGDVITNQICENNFTLARTYRATDVCGNTITCVQVITVLDDTPPLITLPDGLLTGDTMSVQCYGQIPEWDLPSFDGGSVQASDNCTGPVTVVFNRSLPSEGNCVDGFINLYRLTWTATDVCGNRDSAFIFLSLVDTIPPAIFGVPLDITVSCSEIPEVPNFVYAIDECLCACIVLVEETLPVPGCQFGQVIVRSWIATDECGNQTIATQRITLVDDEPPVFVGILDTACINDPALYNVVAVDNCGGPTVLLFQDFNTPNPCGEGNAIRRVYEAYDACGNVARDTVILLLNEQNISGLVFVNPILAALDSGEVITLDYAPLNGHYTAFGIHDVRVEGACLLSSTIHFTETVLETGNCDEDGFILVIELKWTATDICGNFSELTAIVRMTDQSNPNFVNFVSETTISCNEAFPENFGTDNSGEVTMTTRDTTIRGDCIYDYDVLRSVTLRDSCGNTTTREQTIHVQSLPPVITGVEEEICDDLSIPVVTAFDPCSGTFVAVTMQEDTLDVPCSGLSIVRTWTATGSCGHVTVIHQTIVINDHTPPVIIVPAQSVILPFMDQDYNLIPASQIYLIGNLNALDENSVLVLDDCDQEITPVLTVKITYAEDCEAEGYFERRTYTWMATDACGNMAAFTFSVDIMDDLAPEFSFSETTADVTIICAPLPPAPEVHAVDLAQPATINYTETIVPGSAPGEFFVTRTWVATDACGNTATFVQHITWIPDTFLECEIIVPETVECNTHGVIISSTVTGGVGTITYHWEIVGEKCFIQGGQGTPEIIIYVGWSEVKIILTVTDAHGCTSMCMIFLDCVTLPDNPLTPIVTNPETEDATSAPTTGDTPERGAKENLQQIRLWPNPSSGTVNLSFESAIEEVVQFQFINLLGQVILSDKIIARAGLNTVEIDVSLVSEGSHLVQVKTDEEIHTKVVVIMEND